MGAGEHSRLEKDALHYIPRLRRDGLAWFHGVTHVIDPQQRMSVALFEKDPSIDILSIFMQIDTQ
jgi:hypothetical protein